MSVRIMNGDCRDVLRSLPNASVQACVTSPPYFGLRDYGVDGQIGLEPTPDEFVAAMVEVFREVRRVLRDDGTLWLNLGDSYNNRTKVRSSSHQPALNGFADEDWSTRAARGGVRMSNMPGLKEKDLIGIPWMVAFALRADGWYLRQRMPWVKRNPMPESTRDRPTSAVEEVFLLSKSPAYFYDYEAVKKTMAASSIGRLAQDVDAQEGSARANAGRKTNGRMKAVGGDKQRGHSRRHAGFNDRWDKMEREEQRSERAYRNTDLFFSSLEAPHGAIGNDEEIIALDVATQPFREAHFATFPPALIEPLIKAATRPGDIVLDPFGGAGTTGLVADRLGRNAILIELNPDYVGIAENRLRGDAGMFANILGAAE